MNRKWIAGVACVSLWLLIGSSAAMAQEPPPDEPPPNPPPEEVQPPQPQPQPDDQPGEPPQPVPPDEVAPVPPAPEGSPPIDRPIPQPTPEARERFNRARPGEPAANPNPADAAAARARERAARRAQRGTSNPAQTPPTPGAISPGSITAPPTPNGQEFNVPKPTDGVDASTAASAPNMTQRRPTPSSGLPPSIGTETGEKPRVAFDIKYEEKPLGRVMIELNPAVAPKAVENFLQYVDSGYYNGTIFHRIVADFVVQGGGYTALDTPKTDGLRPPIENEAKPTTRHERGTIALARIHRDRNSATSQFFINLDDNRKLDRQYYTVFGTIVQGMDTIDRIGALQTEPNALERRANTRPLKAPMISRAYRLPPSNRRREAPLPTPPNAPGTTTPTPIVDEAMQVPAQANPAPTDPGVVAPPAVSPTGQPAPHNPVTPEGAPSPTGGGEVPQPAIDPHAPTDGREDRPPQDPNQPADAGGRGPIPSPANPPPATTQPIQPTQPTQPTPNAIRAPMPDPNPNAPKPRGVDAVRQRNTLRPAPGDQTGETPKPAPPPPGSPNDPRI